MIGRNGVLHLLEGIVETVFEEISNLILLFIENFLQTLQEWLNLFSSRIKPLLKHINGLLLLFISLIKLG
jgi:hypothetical protein